MESRGLEVGKKVCSPGHGAGPGTAKSARGAPVHVLRSTFRGGTAASQVGQEDELEVVGLFLHRLHQVQSGASDIVDLHDLVE